MASLEITCTLDCLGSIREFVRMELRQMNVPGPLAHQLVLAVDEACTNTIVHQHSNDGKSKFVLTIEKAGSKILFEIEDHGTPYDIARKKSADIKELIRQKKRGGLGLEIISKIMDNVEVLQKKGSFTYRLTKILKV